jgi:hypothetical protein
MRDVTRIRISDDQRRARLVSRHLLSGAGVQTAEAVTAAVIGLHATDPASVHLAAAVRGALPDGSAMPEPVDRALYEDRTLARALAMRRTMFVVRTDFADVVHAGAARGVAERERTKLLRFLGDNGLGGTDPGQFVADLEDQTIAALAGMGSAYGRDLTAAVPELDRKLEIGGGSWTLGSRVLLLLSAEGRIERGRPRGIWTSTQYAWTLPVRLPPTEDELPTAVARIRLAEAYLRQYGPATAADVQWWTGWTGGQTKQALAGLGRSGTTGAIVVELTDGADAYVLDGDTAETPEAEPSVRLLPALDPTVMGWTGRGFYLDPALRDHTRSDAIFDRSGNPGPTIWWGGRIVGGWAQRPDGSVATRLLLDVPKAAADQMAAAADSLAGRLGPLRVTPRFRTTLERALTASPAG